MRMIDMLLKIKSKIEKLINKSYIILDSVSNFPANHKRHKILIIVPVLFENLYHAKSRETRIDMEINKISLYVH
jgi:hypothetical protein